MLINRFTAITFCHQITDSMMMMMMMMIGRLINPTRRTHANKNDRKSKITYSFICLFRLLMWLPTGHFHYFSLIASTYCSVLITTFPSVHSHICLSLVIFSLLASHSINSLPVRMIWPVSLLAVIIIMIIRMNHTARFTWYHRSRSHPDRCP